jgi:hypothetical protein
MKKKDRFSKTLTIIGTVLVWIPLLAPFVLGLIPLIMDDIYRFDFLMPMELGILVFGSGALLLWAAIRAKLRWSLIAGGLSIAVLSMGILISLGDIDPESQQLMIVIGLLTAYSLAIVLMGTGGILLWRDLSKKEV